MRVLLALACTLPLLLSGCFWWSDSVDSAEDPADPEFAFLLLGMLLLVGVVLLVLNLSGVSLTSAPPPSPPPEEREPRPGWVEVTERGTASARGPGKPASKPAKPRRRSP